MKIWIDAQLSPDVAPWISKSFGVEASAVRDLGLRDAKDRAICEAASAAGATIMTKDRDFVDLLAARGPKPKVLWVTCRNRGEA